MIQDNKNGFTLIELLIVVAIIAILAAIAIPNFLAAQMRSKVARTYASLQTIATALESYCVDNNVYPFYTDGPPTAIDHEIPILISTPVAYITSIPLDIFSQQPGNTTLFRGDNFHYLTEDYNPGLVVSTLSTDGVSAYDNAKWMSWSNGPEGHDDHGGKMIYDPTNGIVSNGNLIRWGP